MTRIAVSTVIGLVVIGVVLLVMAFVLAHQTGFASKTLWDLMDLALTPAVLACVLTFAVWWLDKKRAETEQAVALDRMREERLQAYLDKLTGLLEKGLQSSRTDLGIQQNPDPLINVARVRTLTVLRGLNGERKGLLLCFLFDSMLIQKGIISLQKADLSNALLAGATLSTANLSKTVLDDANLCAADLFGCDLSKASLQSANLRRADLTGANLSGANLTCANLSNAHLGYAKLTEANLTNANLSGAYLGSVNLAFTDLSGADLSETFLSGFVFSKEQLAQVKSLKGAIMPDGTKHD